MIDVKDNKVLLFTYGTLTKNHFTMGNAKFIDKVKTDDEYFKGKLIGILIYLKDQKGL